MSLLLLVLALVLPLWVADASAQERGDLLTFGITGSVPPETPDSRTPGYVLGLERVQRLMLDVVETPRDADTVDSALEGTGVTVADLVAMGLLREENGAYVIDFAFFTAADQRSLRDVSERFGRSLAEEYLARRPRFNEIFDAYPLEHVDPSAVAFLVLGCFSLDWDGLDLTRELGYRGVAPERMRDRGYLPYAQEKQSDLSIKGYYWGSHNEYLGARTLTSFGDHYSVPRNSFPDIAWQMYRQLRAIELAEKLRRPLLGLAYRDLELFMEDVIAVMMPLRSGPKNAEQISRLAGIDSTETCQLLELLEALEYVRLEGGVYSAVIPVLGAADARMAHEALQLSREIMTAWLRENYERIRADLGEITPLRYGVPYEETFTQIWHYVFGVTNRVLAEEGMFYDPYGGTRTYEGFLPAVWHRAVRR